MIVIFVQFDCDICSVFVQGKNPMLVSELDSISADLVSPRKSVETTMSVVYPRMPFRGPASLAALSTWKRVSQNNLTNLGFSNTAQISS